MSDTPIQTYEPGHAGMYTISGGNGTYVKRADHLKELEDLRNTIDEMLRTVGKNAANITDPVEAIRLTYLNLVTAREEQQVHIRELDALRAQLRSKDEQLAGMREALEPVTDEEMWAFSLHQIDVVQPYRKLPVLTLSQVNKLFASRLSGPSPAQEGTCEKS